MTNGMNEDLPDNFNRIEIETLSHQMMMDAGMLRIVRGGIENLENKKKELEISMESKKRMIEKLGGTSNYWGGLLGKS